MRVLILGGDGYLGWPTAMRVSARGHEVSVVDTAQGIEVLACDRGSPAEIALRPGDVILGLGGYLTRTTAELVDVLRLTPPRSVAPVLVVRNHVIIQLHVQVAPHP